MKHRSIFDILRSQPRVVLHKLYNPQNPSAQWTCLAVFQSLNPLARCLIMRLLYLPIKFEDKIPTPLPPNLSEYVTEFSEDQLLENFIKISVEKSKLLLKELKHLEIITVTNSTTNKYCLNPLFQTSLQNILISPSNPWNYSSENLNICPTVESLLNFSYSSWNKLLNFIVGIDKSIDPTIIKFLETSKIISKSPLGGYKITSHGYEFILKDYSNQIWEYILYCIGLCKSLNISIDEIFSLLFMLSYTELGKPYQIKLLTENQKKFLYEFSLLGIIYIPSKDSEFFFPTLIAVNMIFGLTNHDSLQKNNLKDNYQTLNSLIPSSLPSKSSVNILQEANNPSKGLLLPSLESSLNTNTLVNTTDSFFASSKLEIIVETNLQVTAYLTSDLHLAILKIFVDIEVRMPNMIIGRLTRDKLREAFRIGIKSVQILEFLISHTHSEVLKEIALSKDSLSLSSGIGSVTQPVPENVIDQIILWENELNRISAEDAVVICCQDIYDLAANNINNSISDATPKRLLEVSEYYQEIVTLLKNSKCGLLWTDPKSYYIACKPEGEKIIQKYIIEHVLV